MPKPFRDPSERPQPRRREERPPLRIFPTTLWEYPSQHYDSPAMREAQKAERLHRGEAPRPLEIQGDAVVGAGGMQGDKDYVGATPSWVIWQLLSRYTRENDVVVDPMCCSGTTLDVCRDLGRKSVGFDLNPQRPEIRRNDSRTLPLDDGSVDFVFIDPPYSTHVDYSDDPRCIGKLDSGGDDGGRAYYRAMEDVVREIHRVLKPGRYMGLYVSDSWRKKKGAQGEKMKGGEFMPIGFELFAIMRKYLSPVDIVCVVRHNKKLGFGNWRKAAEEGNFFLRGFNYCFIMRKAPAARG
ncbi:MAG: TRM11 family SAM-dependent methyltransferase [Planctomycetota bacterium]